MSDYELGYRDAIAGVHRVDQESTLYHEGYDHGKQDRNMPEQGPRHGRIQLATPPVDPPFRLSNDPPKHRPQRFENNYATQRVLIEGLGCLPGQQDLF